MTADPLQLILSGDFFQLPPVPDRTSNGQEIPAHFTFEARSWKRCIRHTVVLNKVFRQRDEGMSSSLCKPFLNQHPCPEFITILNEMRFGKVSHHAERILCQLSRKLWYDDGLEPTDL